MMIMMMMKCRAFKGPAAVVEAGQRVSRACLPAAGQQGLEGEA